MYVVRDVFHCKPGKAKELIEKFKKAFDAMTEEFSNGRIMVDFVADYWTVVIEADFEKLDDFERHMSGYGMRPEVTKAMEGYMDLLIEGHREIYRIV